MAKYNNKPNYRPNLKDIGKRVLMIAGAVIPTLYLAGCNWFNNPEPKTPTPFQPVGTPYCTLENMVDTQTPTPTATLNDIATATPSMTPTPETIGGPSPFVIAYGFAEAPCGIDENELGYLVLGPGCYHQPKGNVPADEVALVDLLHAPKGGNLNLRVFNPSNGAELYKLDGPVELNEFNAFVYQDVNGNWYMLCGAPSIDKLGDYVCKVGVKSADMDNGEIQVPVEITVPVTITDGNSGGNGTKPTPGWTPPPQPTSDPD